MPSYIFRLPANTAGLPVTVYAATDTAFATPVASGALGSSATYTTTLPVGNYTARSRSALRDTWYESAEELVTRFDPEGVDSEALRAAYRSVAAGGNRVAFLGDSITNFGGADPGTGVLADALSNGHTSYASLMTGGQAVRVKNAGVAGNTAEMMLARFDADITPYAPNVVVVLAGTNDARQAWPLSRYTDAMKALVVKIRGIGALPVLCTIPPTNETTITTAKRDVLIYNSWIRRYCAAQAIPLVGLHSLLVDPATGGYLTGATSDGVHPQKPYFAPMGRATAAVLKSVLPPSAPPLASDNTTTVNMITNGLFLNQTGTAPTVYPTGWIVSSGNGYTGTFGTDAAVAGNYYRINPNGIGVSAINQTVSTGFSPGDRLLFTGKVRSDGLLAASVFINLYTGGSLTASARPLDALPDVIDAWGVMACEFTVPAGITSLRVYAQVANGAAAAVDYAQFQLLNLTTSGVLAAA